MKVSSIKPYAPVSKQKTGNQSFGNAYASMALVNCGKKVENIVDFFNYNFAKTFLKQQAEAQQIIEQTNKKFFSGMDVPIKCVNDLVEKVNVINLNAGKGSRFHEVADGVAILQNLPAGTYNKCTIPYYIGKEKAPLFIPELSMAMGKHFASENGYEKIIAEKPSGTMGDIIKKYFNEEPKDTIIICGDNVFDTDSKTMLEFFIKILNDPKKQFGAVGVARTPAQVDKQFGILNISKRDPITGLYPLNDIIEKPPKEIAEKYTQPFTTEDGKVININIANTGITVFKKNAMESIVNHVREDIAEGRKPFIAKNDNEIYDQTIAINKLLKNFKNGEAAVYLTPRAWEDIGTPKAYVKLLNTMKEGKFLQNLSDERRADILEALNTPGRVSPNHIQFTLNPNGKTVVDGIDIIA